MKKQEAQSVGEIIEQAIRSTGNSDDYDRQQLCYMWQEVVGPSINQYTTRRWVEHDVLHVCLTSAPLKNELQFHRARLVDMLNKAVGKNVITDIKIH